MAQPPWAGLCVLCPSAWLPVELRDPQDVDVEDYCICLLRGKGFSATFPGGELSASDRAMARANLGDEVFLGLRLAAVRRTFELAGIMVAANPPPSFARQELQKILLREGPMAFHAFLDDWGIRIRPDELLELAWLLVPGARGEEHIFLVQAPDAHEVTWAGVYDEEFQCVSWVTPTRALQLYSQGKVDLTLTHWFVLHELARCLPRLQALPDLPSNSPDSFSLLWKSRALKLWERGEQVSDDSVQSLLLPGDEEHPELPGKLGERQRVLISGATSQVRSLQHSKPQEASWARSSL